MTVKELYDMLASIIKENPADGDLEVAYWTGAKEPEFVQGATIEESEEDEDENDDEESGEIPTRYLQLF